MKRTKILLILATGFAWAWISSVAATEVYTWTDQDGIVHYSDSPLSGGESLKIKIGGTYRPGTTGAYPPSEAPAASAAVSSQAGAGESPQSAAQRRREQIAEDREERREAKAEIDQMCAKHRQRLTQMEPARRVFYTNEKGESVRMDDGPRMEMIKEDKEFIAKNCE
jgi:hypothetical protein